MNRRLLRLLLPVLFDVCRKLVLFKTDNGHMLSRKGTYAYTLSVTNKQTSGQEIVRLKSLLAVALAYIKYIDISIEPFISMHNISNSN